MHMKIVAILGSPRKNGNSTTLATIIADDLANRGATVITHCLNDLSYRGCQACGACKTTSDKCVLKDDLALVLEDVHHADVLILATPVYWGEVSAQMKAFIDRIYSFLTPDFMTEPIKHRLAAGKSLVFIQAQGAQEEQLFTDIFPRYNSFFTQLNLFEKSFFLRACGVNDRKDAATRSDLLDRAKEIAAQLSA